MTADIRTVHRGGSRFYVRADQPDRKAPGVTSVIGMLAKPFLAPWNAKLAAEYAVDMAEELPRMVERDRQGTIDLIKGAARRYTASRSRIGSDAHDMFERMMRGEHIGRVHPDMEPYRTGFAEFLAAVNPELVRAEDVAWSETHDYAGSFDAILRVWFDPDAETPTITPDRSGVPALLIVDWKTSKDTHAEVALQLSAYANADYVLTADGDKWVIPELDGGAVLHITPDQWSFIPVRIDRDVFEFFLALRHVFTWDRDANKTVLGRKLAQSARKLITGTQRRGK